MLAHLHHNVIFMLTVCMIFNALLQVLQQIHSLWLKWLKIWLLSSVLVQEVIWSGKSMGNFLWSHLKNHGQLVVQRESNLGIWQPCLIPATSYKVFMLEIRWSCMSFTSSLMKVWVWRLLIHALLQSHVSGRWSSSIISQFFYRQIMTKRIHSSLIQKRRLLILQ